MEMSTGWDLDGGGPNCNRAESFGCIGGGVRLGLRAQALGLRMVDLRR